MKLSLETPISIQGRIAPHQSKTHVEHRFEVQVGSKRIEIDFDYAPKATGHSVLLNQISLSLYAPSGPRGARHNNADQKIILADGYASRGYLPGVIEPGVWTVSIDVHRILPPESVTYDLRINIADEPGSERTTVFAPATTAPRGPGWYRGDLHGHTFHSDAAWNVVEFIAYARSIGLDFVTLTDHNTSSGVAEARSLAGDDLLVMGGTELTTYWGHCLTIGKKEVCDWRVTSDRPMSSIANEEMADGQLFVIAHPTNIGDPDCTGCDWRYADMMPGAARLVEVWNGDRSGNANNEKAIELYFTWLNKGRRMVATAGSDIHGPFHEHARPGYNVVFAEEFDERRLLDGLRMGHAYVSSGPILGLAGQRDTQQAIMGDTLNCQFFELSFSWSDGPENGVINLVRKGDSTSQASQSTMVGSGAGGNGKISIETTHERDWVLLELRDQSGALHAMTNPIFFGRLGWPQVPTLYCPPK